MKKKGYYNFSWTSAGKRRTLKLQDEKKRIIEKEEITTLAGKEKDTRASAGKNEAIRN